MKRPFLKVLAEVIEMDQGVRHLANISKELEKEEMVESVKRRYTESELEFKIDGQNFKITFDPNRGYILHLSNNFRKFAGHGTQKALLEIIKALEFFGYIEDKPQSFEMQKVG